MTWNCKYFDINNKTIKNYDVLYYAEEQIKKLKRKNATLDNFSKALRAEMMSKYWCRYEYELIIQKTEEGQIILKPWTGCAHSELIQLNVTDDNTFDWKNFADFCLSKQISKDFAKIDIYSQLEYKWDDFVDYCWNYKSKYARKRKTI